MTIAPEVTTAPPPLALGAPRGAADLTVMAGLRSVSATLSRVDSSRLDAAGGVSPRVAAAVLGELDRVIGRLQGLRLSVLAAADRSQVAGLGGFSGTGAWAASATRGDSAQAARDVRLATALNDTGLATTRAAVTAGEVSTDKAGIIVRAIEALPADLSTSSRDRIQTSLVETARTSDPGSLRKAGRRALVLAAAEVDARAAKEHEVRVLQSEEERAYAKCRMTLHDNGDGTTSGSFTVPTPTASILRKVVQQLTSPRRAASDHTTGHRDGGRWARAQGQAFAQLLEHLPTDRLHGKVAATVVVTVDHGDLRSQLGVAHLDTGHDLTAGQARRLACNAGILPAVLGGASLPLDLGRQERFYTEHQRVALATVYDACAAEGCDRPYAWSELHHEDPWRQGGNTDLHLAVPLCGWHHRRVHDPTYDATTTTSRDGIKTVTLHRRE